MSAFYQLEGEKRGNPACLGGSREVETERGLCAPYHLGQVSLLVALHDMYLPCIWTDGPLPTFPDSPGCKARDRRER